jgi:TatD DNase family protein
MYFFDSHAHLESSRFDADRLDVIARAHSAGVLCLVTCGSDLESSAAEIALAAEYPGVYAAVGVHGHRALSAIQGQQDGDWQLNGATIERVAELAGEPGVVAIGEIGLDYHYDFAPRAVQRATLQRQLALAAELNLPVILHNRESDEDMRRMVDAAPATLRGVMHCFLSDQAMADWALARGLYIGVAGPITFKNVRHLDETVRHVPLDRLLIETDCPYLAPHPKRGHRNEPAYVRHVAEKLAQVLGLPLSELARRTTENACRLFGVS